MRFSMWKMTISLRGKTNTTIIFEILFSKDAGLHIFICGDLWGEEKFILKMVGIHCSISVVKSERKVYRLSPLKCFLSLDETQLWKPFPLEANKKANINYSLFIFSSHFPSKSGNSFPQSSCVYENTSFQEPAVDLYLVQAPLCVLLLGIVPSHKISMGFCPPHNFHSDWFAF